MIVTKIGDSLAVRLSADDVARLGLKEGDEVVVEVKRAEPQVSTEEAAKRREEAFERLRNFQGMMPPDFKFDRDEANER
ncbi:AbrB family transcriptional regulator [Tardiphaga sp. vice352]|uniref:AbrB/MazE/SpoVT family DNA-binding domain-containing protein n=1 Tax=unclassified Tardiphaga TaxID=2631404 RepID=UPI001164142A|nr:MULTISPECIES: AbrB family transcriptional regulator [unclassified Tardiphaga]QDM18734.1 AbrB family transcriptional regulator [Tardiphaga sp. vice278]QDM23730.1 AbrB family transcriptional regulator [Tardiphaga sp. vice154]QDM28953.1 AbrB family transcriptional regulator [Tardiphaga sp. vice304]QDM34052.1 AbrB family transcriptional regulator [Tardiphaga sp. vice352]